MNDTILLMLGREVILPSESLIFYHSSIKKFENINSIGNWFSPIKIKEKEKYYHNNNIHTDDKPLWYNEYDFRFINKKPLKLLVIKSYSNDNDYTKLIYMITIINENIKANINDTFLLKNEIEEEKRFLLGQENDQEYILSYYLCKYSSFDGWITDASYLGFCMLKKECLTKLKLLSVTEPPNKDNVTMYYTEKQWKEQFI
jgi:hypothetical protein